MDYHDIQKTRVTDLRVMAKEHLPDVKGLSGLKKEDLVNMLAEKLGIEQPHKHVAAGMGKRVIKAKIRELKKERVAAMEAGQVEDLRRVRKEIHRRKRRLRRMMQLD